MSIALTSECSLLSWMIASRYRLSPSVNPRDRISSKETSCGSSMPLDVVATEPWLLVSSLLTAMVETPLSDSFIWVASTSAVSVWSSWSLAFSGAWISKPPIIPSAFRWATSVLPKYSVALFESVFHGISVLSALSFWRLIGPAPLG